MGFVKSADHRDAIAECLAETQPFFGSQELILASFWLVNGVWRLDGEGSDAKIEKEGPSSAGLVLFEFEGAGCVLKEWGFGVEKFGEESGFVKFFVAILKIRSVSEDVFFTAVSMEVNESMKLVSMSVSELPAKFFQCHNLRIGNLIFRMKRAIEVVPQVVYNKVKITGSEVSKDDAVWIDDWNDFYDGGI